MTPREMGGYAELALAAFVIAILKWWPRIWRVLRFPGSSGWPTLQATVAQVLVQSYLRRSRTRYRAEISYCYEVNGEYYSGYYQGDETSSESKAEGLVKAYPKGTILQVHVHPHKPELSVLSL